MPTAPRLIVAALAGAAVAGIAAFALHNLSVGHAAPSVADHAGPASATAVPDPATAAAIAGLHERIAALQAIVVAFDRKLDDALSLRERAAPAPDGGAPAATIDPAALQRAIEAAQTKAERGRFDAMKPGEVLADASELVNTHKDLGKARQLLEDLLRRSLTPAERQDALIELGIAHRSGNDFESSRATLQQAIDLAGGTANEKGAWAAFQMAWTHQFADDAAGARRWFDQVAQSGGSGAPLRIEGRWNAAKLAAAAGDPSVRAELAAVLRDCGDDPAYANIVADVKARLAR